MAQSLAMPVSPCVSIISGRNANLSLPTPSSISVSSLNKLQYRGLTIRCARVGGVEIPNNKRIAASLQYIHGIGRTISKQVLFDLGMENKVTKDLSEEELISLRSEVSKYMIEGDLRRFNTLAIRRLKEIQCYRGRRHIRGMPCRGQRTKNNCRTLKGKRATVRGD
ncbi:ribosomal 40S subunit protein S13 [Asimina triloba]